MLKTLLLVSLLHGMMVKEGLELLRSLDQDADLERAVHSWVSAEHFKTCSSLDGPTCIHLGVSPPGLSELRTMLSTAGWSVEELKERMNEAEVVQVLMAWWNRGRRGVAEALRMAGAVDLATLAESRLPDDD